jgi:hypothetical protein
VNIHKYINRDYETSFSQLLSDEILKTETRGDVPPRSASAVDLVRLVTQYRTHDCSSFENGF